MNIIVKYSPAILIALVVSLGIGAYTGCASHPVTANVSTGDSGNISGGATVGVNDHVDVGVNGTGNPNDGTWTAGVTVTFKDPPPDTVVQALLAAGATDIRSSGNSAQYIITRYDRTNAKQVDALAQALQVGATISGYGK